MKINIKNLGIIKNAEIDLSKDLIVFTGYNNTGKTYLNYLLYGLYKIPYGRIEKQFFSLIQIEDLLTETISLQVNLNKLFLEDLRSIELIYENLLKEFCTTIFDSKDVKPEIEIHFNKNDVENGLTSIEQNFQRNTNFAIGYSEINDYDDKGTVDLEDGILKFNFDRMNQANPKYNQFKEKLKDVVKLNVYLHFEWIVQKIVYFNHIYQRDYNSRTYFFSAERAALNQYTTDIIYSKAEKYEESSNPYPLETDENRRILQPDYPLAINDYIKFVYNLKKIAKRESDFKELALELEQRMLDKGRVFIDEYGAIKFQLQNGKTLDIYETSSTIKSLAGFVLYLRHIAQIDGVIFIDEPELNLHPKNQIIFSRLLAKLVNKGVKIILSTHSDYITKELSSLVLLYKDRNEEDKYWERYSLTEDMFINNENVGLYYFDEEGNVNPHKIDEYGLDIESFNKVIGNQSQMFDNIYFRVGDKE